MSSYASPVLRARCPRDRPGSPRHPPAHPLDRNQLAHRGADRFRRSPLQRGAVVVRLPLHRRAQVHRGPGLRLRPPPRCPRGGRRHAHRRLHPVLAPPPRHVPFHRPRLRQWRRSPQPPQPPRRALRLPLGHLRTRRRLPTAVHRQERRSRPPCQCLRRSVRRSRLRSHRLASHRQGTPRSPRQRYRPAQRRRRAPYTATLERLRSQARGGARSLPLPAESR